MAYRDNADQQKPRYGASRRHLAGRLRQRWCPVLQSAVRRLADGGGAGKEDPWAEPEWYLLSYQKAMTASSSEEGREPSFATDENIQTWWRAAGNQPGEWISMDLGEVKDVRAVQINFADDKIDAPLPGERRGERYIDPSQHKTDGCLRHPPMEQTILFWQINQTQKPICRMISS